MQDRLNIPVFNPHFSNRDFCFTGHTKNVYYKYY
jgi:hypothetical protein